MKINVTTLFAHAPSRALGKYALVLKLVEGLILESRTRVRFYRLRPFCHNAHESLDSRRVLRGKL